MSTQPFLCTMSWIATVQLILLTSVPLLSASAQTVFQSPIQQGRIAYRFNDTNVAKTGWYHSGVDYWGPSGRSTGIVAASVGIVHSITRNNGSDRGMGNCVIIRHTVPSSSHGALATYFTLYAHLDEIAVSIRVGGIVHGGQIIGTMGCTSYGNRFHWGRTPHLHFEVKTAGILSNPSGSGTYFGYMPRDARYYGYVDPAIVIGKWSAIPASR